MMKSSSSRSWLTKRRMVSHDVAASAIIVAVKAIRRWERCFTAEGVLKIAEKAVVKLFLEDIDFFVGAAQIVNLASVAFYGREVALQYLDVGAVVAHLVA